MTHFEKIWFCRGDNLLSNVVNKEVVKKKTVYSKLKTKVHLLYKEIPDPPTLIHINQYNTVKQSLEEKNEDVDKRIPDISGSVTTTVLNTKIKGVKKKIPDLPGLVKKTDSDDKILEIEGKYFTNTDYNKSTSDILDAKI